VDSIQEGVRESRLAANRVFGVPLHLLATGDGKVPLVVDRLITTIEMYGLYTEGIYRKSGVSRNQIRLETLLGADARRPLLGIVWSSVHGIRTMIRDAEGP